MEKKEIVDQLNNFASWITVSNKKFIIKAVLNCVEKNEKIINLLEGIYKGDNDNSFKLNIHGILLLTDKRIIFISGENTFRDKLILKLDEVFSIDQEKSFAFITMFIRYNKKVFSFDSVNKEENVNKFINDFIVLSNIKEMDRDQIIIEESPHKINKKSDSENFNFLFSEAVKINNSLKEIITDYGLIKDLIIDDLCILTKLSLTNDCILDEEKFFAVSVLMPLIDDNFAKTAQNAPADILKNWDKINPKLEKIGENFESISLLSVETIRQFDEKELKLNYDKIRSVYYNYSQCIIKADGSINPQEESRLKKIFEIIYREKVKKEQNEKIKEVKKEEAKKEKLVEKAEVKEITLDEVMKDIDKLIGMKKIKDQIKTLINLIKVQKAREERKLPVTRVSLHSVFYGPPGTGKTTIARLLGKVFKCLGILTQGQIIETDRAGLVAGYVGQTAIKTDELLNKALDGILFIDEAYALKPKESTNDFGQEAINIILKRMEDYRDRLIVITAGYPDEMKVFIESNPGLKSRFNRYFYFDHYTPKELFEIFKILCDNSQFKLENNAKNKLIRLFQLLYDNRDRTFGNGRLVRNLYERILEKQANRIAGITPLSEEILNTLNENDILNVDEI